MLSDFFLTTTENCEKKKISTDSLVQFVKSVRDSLDNRDAELLAEFRNVVIAHATERFRILLEGQIRRAPFLEEFRQRVGRLTPNYEQPGIQFPQGAIQILQALQQKPCVRVRYA